MGELAKDGVEAPNSKVLALLRDKITDYPAGKDRKVILIFSPHPDDDVICMAGSMTKMVQ